MKLNIPILLTYFRVLLIPIFVILFYLPIQSSAFWVALIFLIAALTDMLDGYLARKWNQTTKFGAFLDPVADKIMVTAALVLITQYYHVWYVTLPALIMISREVVISALREWMAELGKRGHIAVSIWGKVKTISQMTALTWLLWRPEAFGGIVIYAGLFMLYVAVILTLVSMFQYLNASKKDLLSDAP